MTFGFNQIWGSIVIIVGVVWILRKNVPAGIRGRPPSFYVKGKWAVFIGISAIILGLFFALDIPKQIEIDSCLDSGGSYDYEKEECVYTTSENHSN